MGIYAALGVGQALTAFFMGIMFSLIVYSASQRLHNVGPLSLCGLSGYIH